MTRRPQIDLNHYASLSDLLRAADKAVYLSVIKVSESDGVECEDSGLDMRTLSAAFYTRNRHLHRWELATVDPDITWDLVADTVRLAGYPVERGDWTPQSVEKVLFSAL